ncbi:Sodium/calcium exchanger protein-domain-containing protein [Aspergillus egyptiacus]|nr:Sodium/calcium exchanger protein-domain-containing protein [Aspergillus egyptiacus]
MVPAANLLGFAGSELAKKLPRVLGVLLETALSSVVEIILFMVLVHKDKNGNLIYVIQAAILGSILANLLLCLGLCFFFGGLGREHQVFHEAVSEVGSGLLLVAGFGLLIPSAFYAALSSNSTNAQATQEEIAHFALIISRATAIILMAAFLMYLFYNLHSHNTIYDEILQHDENRDEDREREEKRAKLTMTECLIAVAISMTCVAMSAVFLVQEIEHIVHEHGVSDNFMGLILVPVVEKAAEHLTAIDEAWDNQINFALFHCLGPSIQTALLNAPLAVIVGWCLSKDVSLNFEMFMIVLVVLSILVVGNFLRDGKSNYLEGGLCVMVYIIIAVTSWYYPYLPMDPAQALIYALKERNITPKRDEITAAFQDESDSAQNAEWVRKHLTPDTLLSAEEVILYSKLERSSTLTGILADTDIDSTRPFLDGDLQKAIEALNTSTAEIQRQTDILTSQYDILRRQLKRDEDREARRNRQSERLRQKHDAGRQNVAAASSELALEFETSLKNESEKSMMDGKKILSALTARIKEDDKILSDLERLAAGVNSSVDDASVMRRTSDLSNALAQYVSEEIYCRLDRLYLEAVLGSSKTVSHVSNDAATKAVVSLEEELDSLYPEVDILAEMSTKQQFVEPILRELQNHHGQLRIVSHQKLDYILGTVTDMTTSTERLIASLERRESFCATLEALASAFRSEAGDQVLGSTRSRRETMRRFSTQPTPTTTQPAKKPCSFHESESLSGIFRRVGISSESVFHSEEAGNAADTLTQERQRMLDGLRNYGVASDSPLPVELLSTDRAIRLLSSSLEADSPFAASLSSVEHEESLSELESKLGRIQKGIQGLNQDVIYQRDKNQENFLRKWG